MKLTARGGTDGANMVLFWPDNLPDDADLILQDDPTTLVDQLRNDGKLIWFVCEGDGDYSVAVYLHIPIPEHLAAMCKDEERYPKLVVKGDGYFGGMEYLFKREASLRKKYPGMCEKITIPDGTYAATVYRTIVSERLRTAWLLEHAGRLAKWMSDIQGVILLCAAFSVLVSLLSLCVVSWVAWFYIVGVTVVLVAITFSLSRSRWCKAVAQAVLEFENEYPSYVVRLE